MSIVVILRWILWKWICTWSATFCHRCCGGMFVCRHVWEVPSENAHSWKDRSNTLHWYFNGAWTPCIRTWSKSVISFNWYHDFVTIPRILITSGTMFHAIQFQCGACSLQLDLNVRFSLSSFEFSHFATWFVPSECNRITHTGNSDICSLVSAIGDTYGAALLLHMLTSTICLTLLAYQATKINGVNVYAFTTIGYLVYSLGQVFHFCIYGNRLIEEVSVFSIENDRIATGWRHVRTPSPENHSFGIPRGCDLHYLFPWLTRIGVELIGYGSSLLLPLVRWLGGGKDIRSDCMPTMPKGDDNFRRQVFHRFIGSVRLSTWSLSWFDIVVVANIQYYCFFVGIRNVGAWCCCNILHGVGAAQVNGSTGQAHRRRTSKNQPANYQLEKNQEEKQTKILYLWHPGTFITYLCISLKSAI